MSRWRPPAMAGTRPIYKVCKGVIGTACDDWGVGTQPDQWGFSTLLGHAYVDAVERTRAITRSTDDGRGGVTTRTYGYTGFAYSADGSEFRGHSSVRDT